jgi:hypothetical protein
MTYTLKDDEYTALVALAKQGKAAAQLRDIDTWLKVIEVRNGVTRFLLLVRWQEARSPAPTTKFPKEWPPTLSLTIEQTSRPISKTDVLEHLKTRAKEPTNIMVSKDPGGELGWFTLDAFFG